MSVGDKTTILYLDDEPACLEVFALTFGGDYEVRTAATIEEARHALDGGPFNVVISDQEMSGASGAAFLREVARTHPQCCRLMLTGSTFVGALIAEIGAGVIHGFLTKPWDGEDVREAIERARLYGAAARAA